MRARTRTRGHEGAGLGLSLVASMVAMHGGSLEIESVVGEGTVVTIRLPGLSTAGQEPVDAEAGQPAGGLDPAII